MSEHLYENRQIALWHEYTELNGRVTFDAFMERHVNVNAWIVNLMRNHGRLTTDAMLDIMHDIWEQVLDIPEGDFNRRRPI